MTTTHGDSAYHVHGCRCAICSDEHLRTCHYRRLRRSRARGLAWVETYHARLLNDLELERERPVTTLAEVTQAARRAVLEDVAA